MAGQQDSQVQALLQGLMSADNEVRIQAEVNIVITFSPNNLSYNLVVTAYDF